MRRDLLSAEIRNLANSSGIDIIGFAEATEFKDYALGNHPRRSPELSLPHAKSIIAAGIYIGGITLPEWENPWYGRTSRLYLSGFFLDVVKPLEPIVELLQSQGFQAKTCNGSIEDGSILPLKLAAIRAGLGWQGKHSLLISKQFGTFLALGGIVTTAELEYNHEEEPNRCRTCTECQEACPVGALEQPYVLNVDRCMSNLLAEEHLPEEVQTAMENRIGDCEICQDACPWNRKHIQKPLSTNMTLRFQTEMDHWRKASSLPELSNFSKDQYQTVFGRLATGIPFAIFHRNVRLALKRIKKIAPIGSTSR